MVSRHKVKRARVKVFCIADRTRTGEVAIRTEYLYSNGKLVEGKGHRVFMGDEVIQGTWDMLMNEIMCVLSKTDDVVLVLDNDGFNGLGPQLLTVVLLVAHETGAVVGSWF